jgi:hypothetical protein
MDQADGFGSIVFEPLKEDRYHVVLQRRLQNFAGIE